MLDTSVKAKTLEIIRAVETQMTAREVLFDVFELLLNITNIHTESST